MVEAFEHLGLAASLTSTHASEPYRKVEMTTDAWTWTLVFRPVVFLDTSKGTRTVCVGDAVVVVKSGNSIIEVTRPR